MTAPRDRSDSIAGILAMCAAMLAYIVSDVFSKLAGAALPIGQLITLRGIYTVVIFAVPVLLTGVLPQLRQRFSRLWALRIAAEMGTVSCFISALLHLKLANVVAITQTVPLVTTIAGALLLGERATPRQIMTVLAGFCGVLLITRPDSDGFTWWSIVALGAVAMIALRDLVTRRMDRTIPAALVTFTTALGVSAAGVGISLLEGGWRWPSLLTHVHLIAAAATVGLAYWFTVQAVQKATLAATAPFRYTIVPWSVFAGWLVWREVPTATELYGIALIAAAGLYAYRLQREPNR